MHQVLHNNHLFRILLLSLTYLRCLNKYNCYLIRMSPAAGCCWLVILFIIPFAAEPCKYHSWWGIVILGYYNHGVLLWVSNYIHYDPYTIIYWAYDILCERNKLILLHYLIVFLKYCLPYMLES